MKFLSVRNRASGPGNIGGNEFALAGAVKEVVTRWRSSLPKKKWVGPSLKSTSGQARKLTSWPVDKLSSLCYRII
jgi:hypothetical protein